MTTETLLTLLHDLAANTGGALGDWDDTDLTTLADLAQRAAASAEAALRARYGDDTGFQAYTYPEGADLPAQRAWQGAWLLTAADVGVEYTRPAQGDDSQGEMRLLELGSFGRVLIVALGAEEDGAKPGLTTLVAAPGYCRVCGCSDQNACTGEDDEPCSWVEADLCSRCAERAG